MSASTHSQFSSDTMNDFDNEHMSVSIHEKHNRNDEPIGKDSRHNKTETCPETDHKKQSPRSGHDIDLKEPTHRIQIQNTNNQIIDQGREMHQLGKQQQQQE